VTVKFSTVAFINFTNGRVEHLLAVESWGSYEWDDDGTYLVVHQQHYVHWNKSPHQLATLSGVGPQVNGH